MAECPLKASPACHEGTVLRRRLNTRYVDDESNWLTSCRACFEQAWDEYDSMWSDSGQGHPFSRYAPSDDEVREPAQERK